MSETEVKALGLVDPQGRPLTRGREDCPRCGAKPTRRRPSSGFGQPHDVCGQCGYDFKEFTL